MMVQERPAQFYIIALESCRTSWAPTYMQSQQAPCSEWPCLSVGWIRWSRAPFPPNHAVVLWLWDDPLHPGAVCMAVPVHNRLTRRRDSRWVADTKSKMGAAAWKWCLAAFEGSVILMIEGT